jgi:hypothetical protein
MNVVIEQLAPRGVEGELAFDREIGRQLAGIDGLEVSDVASRLVDVGQGRVTAAVGELAVVLAESEVRSEDRRAFDD